MYILDNTCIKRNLSRTAQIPYLLKSWKLINTGDTQGTKLPPTTQTRKLVIFSMQCCKWYGEISDFNVYIQHCNDGEGHYLFRSRQCYFPEDKIENYFKPLHGRKNNMLTSKSTCFRCIFSEVLVFS
jgi:hypothetical protein